MCIHGSNENGYDICRILSGWRLTYPSEKYEFVNWDDDIPNIWEDKKCFKPPTRCTVLWYMITICYHYMILDDII